MQLKKKSIVNMDTYPFIQAPSNCYKNKYILLALLG